MHFLIDASLPRSASVAVRQLGHYTMDVRDAGMRDAPDRTIAEYAKHNHLALITRDFDFADVLNRPPASVRWLGYHKKHKSTSPLDEEIRAKYPDC